MRWFLGALLGLIGLIAIVGVGGYFALKRPDLPYETLAARYESAASRYVDLPGGVRMHYRDQGIEDGPTLLLIHGYSASLHTWEPWVGELDNAYRLVSLDLPGHGLTRAPAGYQASIEGFRDIVHQFVTALELDRFSIAGSSMGGNVAWEYALAHPERVDALVLVGASGWEDTRPETSEEPPVFALLRNPVVGPLIRDLDSSRLIREGLEASFVDESLVTQDMVDRYSELSRAPGHREILLQLSMGFRSRNYATPERLAPLNIPVLILHGDTDRLVPTEHGGQFHEAIGGSELMVLENTGHIPHEERPAETALAVHEFLSPVYEGAALAPLPEIDCETDARC